MTVAGRCSFVAAEGRELAFSGDGLADGRTHLLYSAHLQEGLQDATGRWRVGSGFEAAPT
jgi:hypothetical protein